jgi:hypothetical protein
MVLFIMPNLRECSMERHAVGLALLRQVLGELVEGLGGGGESAAVNSFVAR